MSKFCTKINCKQLEAAKIAAPVENNCDSVCIRGERQCCAFCTIAYCRDRLTKYLPPEKRTKLLMLSKLEDK
jgi:hypothetical protein